MATDRFDSERNRYYHKAWLSLPCFIELLLLFWVTFYISKALLQRRNWLKWTYQIHENRTSGISCGCCSKADNENDLNHSGCIGASILTRKNSSEGSSLKAILFHVKFYYILRLLLYIFIYLEQTNNWNSASSLISIRKWLYSGER